MIKHSNIWDYGGGGIPIQTTPEDNSTESVPSSTFTQVPGIELRLLGLQKQAISSTHISSLPFFFFFS